MKPLNRIAIPLLTLIFLAGCAAKTNIVSRQEYMGEKIARPDHILVYDFAATPADVPQDSALAGQTTESGTPQTSEQVAAGRQIGAKMAEVLVQEIRGMGLPAERATDRTALRIGDLVIRGTLLSIDEGDAAKRVAVGFGSGASHLKTTVEGYLVTAQGLRRLGSGTEEAGGSTSPGTAMAVAGAVATGNPAGLIVSGAMKIHGEASGGSKIQGRAEDTAKDIAKQLRKKFKEQGWIRG